VGWNVETRRRLRSWCRGLLQLKLRDRVPHPTRIERIRATCLVELRDGRRFEIVEEAWT
jgi:hypothetical protein